MKRELPSRPSLEFLRKEAKQLLDRARSNDADALASLRAVTTSGKPSLHHAQLALAREYGFASWRDLVYRVRTVETDGFLTAVCGDNWDVIKRLKMPPEHVRFGNIHVAAACGDLPALLHLIAKDKPLVKQKGGPEKAAPLLYLCFSRFNRGHETVFAECAELLLKNGADANTSYVHPAYPESPFSVLYGAAGAVHNPNLVEVLLRYGADVNDGECLYHSTETRDHSCLKLLLAQKPKFEGTNAIYRMLDYDDVEGLRLILDAGADPNEAAREGALNHAIRRGRSRAHLELLLERGADPTRLSEEGWTPYRLAIRNSNLVAAKLFQERGWAEASMPTDEFMLACLAGNVQGAKATGVRIEDLADFDLDALVEAGWNLKTEVVRTMLDLGFPVSHRSTAHGQTALHGACWKGSAELVGMLLAAGAPLDVVERQFHAIPLGWACHGSIFARHGDGGYFNSRADYPGVVQMLIQAGSPMPENSQGSDEVNEELANLAEKPS